MAVTSEHVDILEKFLVKVYYPKKVNTNTLTNEIAAFQTTSLYQHQPASPFSTWFDWEYQECVYLRWQGAGRMYCKRANIRCYRIGFAAWKWGWICPTVTNSWWNFQNWQRSTNMQLQKGNVRIVQMAKSGLACLPFFGCKKSWEKLFVIHHYSVSFLFVMCYDNVSLLLILYLSLIAAHFTFAWLFWYDIAWYWIENWFYFLVKLLQTIEIE